MGFLANTALAVSHQSENAGVMGAWSDSVLDKGEDERVQLTLEVHDVHDGGLRDSKGEIHEDVGNEPVVGDVSAALDGCDEGLNMDARGESLLSAMALSFLVRISGFGVAVAEPIPRRDFNFCDC